MRRKQKHRIVRALMIVLGCSLASFIPLRHYQLSLPDPYHNPYTILSTACLDVFLCAFLGLVILRARWRKSLSPTLLDVIDFVTTIVGFRVALLVLAVVPGSWMLVALAFFGFLYRLTTSHEK